MIELRKTESGYECTIEGGSSFDLPTDATIKDVAIQTAIEYDDETTETVRILRDCDIGLEVVDGKDSFEKLIGVVVSVSKADAEILANDNEIYCDLMSAIGEACPDIESDRVVTRETP